MKLCKPVCFRLEKVRLDEKRKFLHPKKLVCRPCFGQFGGFLVSQGLDKKLDRKSISY